MAYYVSLKQILLKRISNLLYLKQSDGINKNNAENDEISNDLEILQEALEQIKSHNDNLYFQSIAKQFECRLNESELKTLQYLTQQSEDSNDCPFIFYKGFKQWYTEKYIGYNDNISNTARSETLFTGTQSDELHQNIFQNNNNNDEDDIYKIWQTILGIQFANDCKTKQIANKQILGGRNAFIDVRKHIHFETAKDKIIKSSLVHICIVHNNIFKIEFKQTQQTSLFHIININIFKLISSILWEPKLASNIINICALHNINQKKKKPETFEEAFEMESAKRLSHKRGQSTKIDLPDIPDTPQDAAQHFEYREEDDQLKNMSIDAPLAQTPPSQKKLGLHGQDKTRGSFNIEEDVEIEEEDDGFYDHQGMHESNYSNEFKLPADMIAEMNMNNTNDDEEEKKEEELVESDLESSVSLHTEYKDDDDINAVMEMIDDNASNRDTDIEENDDKDLESSNKLEIKSQRQDTIVEYDVDNILSGDPATTPITPQSPTSEVSESNSEANEEDNEITPPPPQLLNKKTIELDKDANEVSLDFDLLSSTPQPMNLSKSSPMSAIGHTWSENISLHGYYSNASSDEERWSRLKKRVHRHWDEDVVDQMKTFCEENDFSFEDILDDISDSMDDFDNSMIISHLKEELHWNKAKTLRFYRTLRRILISRQSTQFNGSLQFAIGIGNIHHFRNLSDNYNDDQMIQIDMNPSRISRSQSELPPIGIPSLLNNGRHSNEIRIEKAWFNVEQSLLRKKWTHDVVKEFKSLCEEEEFDIALIIDDIACYEADGSILMDPLKNRLNWNTQTLTKFVEDLRVALTKDLQDNARMSRTFKRAELNFQRTDSFSLSDSKTPGVIVDTPPKDTQQQSHFRYGSDLNVPTIRKMTEDISRNESPKLGPLQDDTSLESLPMFEINATISPNTPPPPPVDKYSTIDSTVSNASSINTIKSVDISDQDTLCHEWKKKCAKNKEQMVEESQTKCGCQQIEECAMYKRLMFVMEFYMSWILINQTENRDIVDIGDEEMYHQISIYTFLSKLESYSCMQLWNDYFHLRQYHNTPNWNDHTQVCMSDTCKILSRYHRDRVSSKDNETRLELYNLKETDQTFEVITQQLCDMIHCTLFHPIALDTNDNDDSINNKVKIVDSKLYNDKLRKMDRMKHHKFLTDDDRMASNHQQSFDTNQELKAKKKSSNKNEKSTNSAYRILPGLGTQKNEWAIFLSLNSKTLEQYSKYQEFRQEILNNDIHKISAEQWNDCWKRAELFKTTWKGKAFEAKRSLPGFRVRKGDPIPTHYILALMLWSNFDLLQYEFRLHAKRIQTQQQNEDENRQKFQFCRWGFWLKACVDCFGQTMKQNEDYFHCFAQKIVFNEMWINFVYPTSVTSSFLITQIYSNNEYNSNGIILALNLSYQQSQIPFIDCSFISDFGYEEEERLIFNGYMDIKYCADFKLIRHHNMHGFEYFIPHFFVLKWWDIMTNVGKYKYFHNELGDEKEKILIELLSSMYANGKNNTNYVQQIFVNLCKRHFLDINLRLLDELLLSTALKEHFIDSKDGRVDFWRLIQLFPNATKFSIKLQKGIGLGSFICEKFLKIIDRQKKVSKHELKLNRVILSSDKKNKNLKEQTKHLMKAFGSRSWVIFLNKAGNKVKFENNHNFAKK